MPVNTALGLDLGIRTGSLVQIKVNHEYNLMEKYRVLHSWTKGPSIKQSVHGITEFFHRNILPWLNEDIVGEDQAIAIDWDRREIHWAAGKTNSNMKTLVAGYIMNHCHNHGITPLFISPAEVRSFFGFNTQKVPKTTVQRHFLLRPTFLSADQRSYSDIKTEHDLDAVILAYIMELKWRAEPCPPSFKVDYQGIWSCKHK